MTVNKLLNNNDVMFILVHGIGGQNGSKLRTKHVVHQDLATFLWKKDIYIYIYMLTVWRVSSAACKCVFYRPEYKANGDSMLLNFKSLEIQ